MLPIVWKCISLPSEVNFVTPATVGFPVKFIVYVPTISSYPAGIVIPKLSLAVRFDLVKTPPSVPF